MDSHNFDGPSSGGFHSGHGDRRPPAPASLRRGGSREATMMRKDSAGSAAELQRRGSVQKLIDHLGAFAQDVNDTHDTDFSGLLHNLQDTEYMMKTMIDEEAKEREKGDRALGKRCDDLGKRCDDLERAMKNADGGPLKERVNALENTFASWADKNTREIETLRKENEALSRQLAALSAAHKQHLDAEDHLDSAVKSLASRGESTARGLAAAEAKLDHIHEGILSCEHTCSAADSKSNALGERLKEAERRLDNSLRSCFKDIEQLKNDHGDLTHHVKTRLTDSNDLIHHQLASHKVRTDLLGECHNELLSKHEGQARDLQNLKDESAKHRKDVSILRQHVEGALGEMSENTAQELKAARDDMEQILGLLSGVQRAWRPGTSRSQGPRRKRLSDEPSPRTPKDLSLDLLKPVEPRTSNTQNAPCVL